MVCISILSDHQDHYNHDHRGHYDLDHHGHHDHHDHHGQVSGWCVPRELEDEPSAAVGFPLWASSGRIQDGDFLLFLLVLAVMEIILTLRWWFSFLTPSSDCRPWLPSCWSETLPCQVRTQDAKLNIIDNLISNQIKSRVSEMMQKSTKALEPFTTGSWTWTSNNTKALQVF